ASPLLILTPPPNSPPVSFHRRTCGQLHSHRSHQPPKMSTMLAARVAPTPVSLSPSPMSGFRFQLRPSPPGSALSLVPRAASSATAVSAKPAAVAPVASDRSVVRIGLPSKGRMAEQTLSLLKSCQLSVKQVNPRQYTADIPLIPNLEVWFQRPKDIVRKLQSGDLDLGIVGFDIVSEYGMGNDDLVVVHDALAFGHCRLSLAVPKEGIFENINSLEDLCKMSEWTEERPLRVVTGFGYLGEKFLRENGFKHVKFLSADGALESYPPSVEWTCTTYLVYLDLCHILGQTSYAHVIILFCCAIAMHRHLVMLTSFPCVQMGMADAIVDLVSSGTTLRENNLKEIEGGVVLESQATLVASRRSLHKREGVLEVTHELLERLEAHLRASSELMVTANMRGSSALEVAQRVSQTSICGLQGPTVSPVYSTDGKVDVEYYAINVVVPQKLLYKSIQQLRSIGGSGVLVTKLTYIFDEETPRWRNLLTELGL
ncbi:hypothetical protein EJB05_43530, partial [Eragrostis curvula]